jgi:hypothetical protein
MVCVASTYQQRTQEQRSKTEMTAMTKAQLIEALDAYPDDAPVVVALGTPWGHRLNRDDYYFTADGSAPDAISISTDPDKVVIEL